MSSDQEDPSASGPRRNDQFVEAFAKGLQVIHGFPITRESATLAEVSQNTGLPRATVRRMLLTLVELGYASQQEDRFRLAPKLLGLGFTYLNSIPFYRTAQDVLETLSNEINELCSLSVLDGTETVYVVHVQGRDLLSRGMGVGTRLPAYATSVGRVLLAALPRQDRDERVRQSRLEKRTPKTLVDPIELHAAIDQVAREGYSLTVEELSPGVIGLSVPVRDRRGNVVAAAGLSLNPGRFNRKKALGELLPRLREAAERIALHLA